MREYEIEFERWNSLSCKHETKHAYFTARSVEEARAYGDLIDILNIKVLVE
jgi:hypothetical protein